MRIAILQGAFLPVPPIQGGAVEKMWFALGKEFAQNGHQVTQISKQSLDLPDSEIIDGVHHIRIKGYDMPKSGLLLKFLDLLYTIKICKLLSANFDVIVSNTFWAPIVLPTKAKQISLVDVARMPKGQMRLYSSVARLRANSTPVAKAIQKEIPDSWSNKVVMIPNPLPFDPTTTVDFIQKKPIILYVGRIHPEKGLDLLINAFKQTDQTYKLQLVGPWQTADGGGGPAYLQYLQKLAGQVAVDFIEPIYDLDKLNQLYLQASIFVYPSIAEKGETFGLAPLEAMAWGCIPIVSNLQCFQDFIRHGENGLIFDHGSSSAIKQLSDCIWQLHTDKQLSTKLAHNALKVRQTHSIHHIAKLFLEEFDHIKDQANGHDGIQ